MSLKAQYDRFQEVINKIPHKPGVYRYYSESEELLYVGKAKDLRKRVVSYFQDSRVHNQRTYMMVNQIAQIQYTLVNTEKEALLLEANLIFSLQPRFNILLKDEQNYLYVRFTYSDEIPGVFIDRRKTSPKYTYYGPFFSRYRVGEILRIIRMIFPYCEKRKVDGKPCAYVAIGQCEGMCVGKEQLPEYLEKLKQVENIFMGKIDLAEEFLASKISLAVKEANYELAGYWRDRLGLLKQMFKRNFSEQKMVLPSPETLDIVTLVVECESDGSAIGSVFVQSIRDGKMVNVNNFLLTGGEGESEEEVYQEYLERFLKSYYIFQNTGFPVLIQAFQKAAEEKV